VNFIYDSSLVLYLPLYELDGNSIVSRDAYGHLSSVNGALWRPYGRYFDGTDDYVSIGRLTPIEGASQDWTIIIWVRSNTTAGTRLLFSYDSNDTAEADDIYMYWNGSLVKFQAGGGGAEQSSSIVDLTDGAFHLIGEIHKGGQVIIAEDGEIKNEVALAAGAFGAGWDFRLGEGLNANHWSGFIGETFVYNRALTPQEIQQNYLATKWRYR